MTSEILLSIIGTLLLILLSALAWALRTLHADLKELGKTLEKAAADLRQELEGVGRMANKHETTLYGSHGNNGLTRDLRDLKDQMGRRRT